MELIQPSYYGRFSCLASACPDGCCYGWEVEIDPHHARLYTALEGSLGDALRGALYQEDGTFYLRNHHDRCPMWQSDGLCTLQAALGHEALSQVCQSFPRLRQDYGDFVELGLEMSCPEAARLMLSSEAWALERQEAPGGEAGDYDPLWMKLLQASRPVAFGLLENSSHPLPHRLALLLLYAYHVQSQLDGMEPREWEPESALQEATAFAAAPNTPALLAFYQNLEILTPRWLEQLSQPAPAPQWPERLARFAQYALYRYYFQAVSDGDLVGRVKMILSGCILCALLGGSEETIQRYAKEIENDADNVDALLDGAYTHPALTDQNLLGLLIRS